jgi:hypothetical protein
MMSPTAAAVLALETMRPASMSAIAAQASRGWTEIFVIRRH